MWKDQEKYLLTKTQDLNIFNNTHFVSFEHVLHARNIARAIPQASFPDHCMMM